MPAVLAGHNQEMAPLTWRPPTRDDDPAWLDLLAAIEAVDQRGETFLAEDLADEWASVWSDATDDAVFAWDDDLLVAFGWMKTQRTTRDRHKLDLWGGVRPSHRGRGIGAQLLRWQLDRAAAVVPSLDPAFPTDARVEASDQQVELRALAEAHGFVPVRTFLELARPIAGSPAPAGPPAGLELHAWDAAFDEATREAHAEAFADHWGSEPRSVEEWRQWYTGHRCFRPDLSVVLLDPAGEVAAYVLCAAYPQDWHSVPREVWIQSVGTRRAWRGKGAARAALTAVLAAAGDAPDDFERAILGVDAENPTGAVRVYRGLGFAEVRSVVTLARPL